MRVSTKPVTDWPACIRSRMVSRPTPVAIKSRAHPIAGAAIVTMVAVEPRSGTDKDSTGEPFRPIVTVGRTSIGVIAVVAVRTYRGHAYEGRANANSDPDRNGRRLGGRSGHQANTQNAKQQ